MERIARLLRSQISAGRAQATLRLSPAELGNLRVHMDLRADLLSLRVDTETAAAHRLLTERSDALRTALAEAGIVLERIEVRPPPDRSALAQDAPQQQDEARPQAGGARGGESGGEHSAAGDDAGAMGDAAVERESEVATESRLNVLA